MTEDLHAGKIRFAESLGWTHVDRVYGTGFKDETGTMKTWHDLAQAALDRCAGSGVAQRAPWQPIETAPKDGTTILAFSPTAKGHRRIQTTWWRRPEDQCGYTGWGEFNTSYWPPTLWMAIPDPAVTSTECGEGK